MWQRFRNTVARFMVGRYGNDQLNRFLFWVYLILWLVTLFLGRSPAGHILSLVMLAVLVIIALRTTSRDIPRRGAENDRFLRWWFPTKEWFAHLGLRIRDIRRCRYRRCPCCKSWLRLPIKRGRRTVTCHRCRGQFRTFIL